MGFFIFCIEQCLLCHFYPYTKHNVYSVHPQRPYTNYFFQYDRIKKEFHRLIKSNLCITLVNEIYRISNILLF